MKDSYLSVSSNVKTEIVIEKSRFICNISKVESEEKAKDFLQKIRNEYKDATHNCYAYIADINGNVVKCSDDGEPQGTAGIPILEALRNNKLFNTIAVITRYFGGIKLGTGGLFRAYSECTIKGINESVIVNNIYSSVLKINCNYTLFSPISSYILKESCVITKTDYLSDGVSLEIVVPLSKESLIFQKIGELSSGKIIPQRLQMIYYGYSL